MDGVTRTRKQQPKIVTPKGRSVRVGKARPVFPTGDSRVYMALCEDPISNMVVCTQDHWERPTQAESLLRLDDYCDRYCVRGLA